MGRALAAGHGVGLLALGPMLLVLILALLAFDVWLYRWLRTVKAMLDDMYTRLAALDRDFRT